MLNPRELLYVLRAYVYNLKNIYINNDLFGDTAAILNFSDWNNYCEIWDYYGILSFSLSVP